MTGLLKIYEIDNINTNMKNISSITAGDCEIMKCLQRYIENRYNRIYIFNKSFADPLSHKVKSPLFYFYDYFFCCRKKTRLELIRISCAVMGIEFSYACETGL